MVSTNPELDEVALSRLDIGTKLVGRIDGPGYCVSTYVDAGEAVLSFSGSIRPEGGTGVGDGDPDANRLRAERRARVMVRRYCAANRIDRLVTLTFAPPFCTDARELRAHVARFIRRLRCERGGKFPYVWVPELHKDGERFHVHVGLDAFINKARLGELWGHGFVDVRLIRSRRGKAETDHARVAARYLSKYVGKAFDAGEAVGCHRYEVAQGFQPKVSRLIFDSEAEARAWASTVMGGDTPSFVWSSSSVDDWQGPPVEVAFWSK